MMADTKPHRQCSDCYYWLGHRCKLIDHGVNPADHAARPSCEYFIRAALRFAFFAKM